MLGVYAPGDAISDADTSRMLFLLNAFLDEQAAQQVYFYGCTTVNASLVVGRSSYTIGQSETSDVVVEKPLSVTYGSATGGLSSSVQGFGYAVGDTGLIHYSSSDATYRITGVFVGGAVYTYVLTYPGTVYFTNPAAATEPSGAQPGKGQGFFLSITANGGPISSSSLVFGSVLDAPVSVVSAIEYKVMAASNPAPGIPDTLNYVNGYPLGTLKVLPSPVEDYTMTFQAWNNRILAWDLFQDFQLSPGVLDTLRTNLAVYAKNYFQSAQIDPAIVAQASFTSGFQRYQSINSRATLDRFTLPTAPKKPT